MDSKREVSPTIGRIRLVAVHGATERHAGPHSHDMSTSIEVHRRDEGSVRLVATRTVAIVHMGRRFDGTASAEAIVRNGVGVRLTKRDMLSMAGGPLSLISLVLAQLIQASLGRPVVTEPFVARADQLAVDDGILEDKDASDKAGALAD